MNSDIIIHHNDHYKQTECGELVLTWQQLW